MKTSVARVGDCSALTFCSGVGVVQTACFVPGHDRASFGPNNSNVSLDVACRDVLEMRHVTTKNATDRRALVVGFDADDVSPTSDRVRTPSPTPHISQQCILPPEGCTLILLNLKPLWLRAVRTIWTECSVLSLRSEQVLESFRVKQAAPSDMDGKVRIHETRTHFFRANRAGINRKKPPFRFESDRESMDPGIWFRRMCVCCHVWRQG